MIAIVDGGSKKDTLERFSLDEVEKCCGKCRFSRIAPDLDMKCMRHKIQTDYVCQCGDWQGKEPAWGKGA